MTVKNVLFIMCDQLRADYLSCYGHPTLKTPHIDSLAASGTRFSKAYVQSPVCGPSRMSFYTGRYVQSHGASWNFYPLPIGEKTLGDYLRPHAIRTAVVGKTHVKADDESIKRLGLHIQSGDGIFLSEGGFEPYARDDGVHPAGRGSLDFSYNNWLRSLGYESENPWHDFANSAAGPEGQVLSGWHMRNAGLAARVKDEHSETAYSTDMAIKFMQEQKDEPWCLHLSYIKPHWPYIVSAPYNRLFSEADVLPAVRSDQELRDGHPVMRAFMEHAEAKSFSREDVRKSVVPTYMGLVRQIDDHLGRLLRFMESTGLRSNTMIIFTSDHGDYLGDHWLGEKELFHDQSARVPLIVCHPETLRPGIVSDDLVQAIDVVPTILDSLGISVPEHIVEGQTLLPTVLSGAEVQRDAAFSEIDYATYEARQTLGVDIDAARGVMVRTHAWKYVHWDGFRPQLFDLADDPEELVDLGDDPRYETVRAEMAQRLFVWMRSRKSRITTSRKMVEKRAEVRDGGGDVRIGIW